MASELRVDKIVPVDGVPTGGGGGIVQVVFAQTNTEASQTNAATTQTTLFWTNLQATITPKFSTSKILVMANQNFNITTSAATQMQWNFYYFHVTIKVGHHVIFLPVKSQKVAIKTYFVHHIPICANKV